MDFGLPTNLGDYFIGPGLEQLIQQLAENDPNRYGTPPTSKSAVEKLSDIKITDETLGSDLSQCAVCTDSFELNGEAKQMPCATSKKMKLQPLNKAHGGGEESTKLKLYSNWRSSCSCRVRIALDLKGLDYEYIGVNLLKGEHKSPEFVKLNPLGYVPVLVDGDIVVSDSFAILLYLEEKYPQNPLLPQDLQKKALNYQAANLVSANMQPHQNLAVIGYIKEKLGPDEMLAWVQHHLRNGFVALEKLLKNNAGKYATGDTPFLADLFLAPQIDVAIKRFDIDMNEFPILSRINESYNEHPAFQAAAPDKQPDAPSEARE
ncbi:Glutathione S-transferase zeta-1 [Castilleja foliolosa]|uniref:glutathione transferase n=1 Tax=Castilleja foliolosa TaxID=1961234 RepID=A0ABD3EB16_9LAMI